MHRLKQLTLLCGDLILLYFSLYISIVIRYLELPQKVDFFKLTPSFTWLYILAALIMFIVGLYDITSAKNRWSFYQKLFLSTCVWFSIGIFYFYLNPKASIAPKTILILNATVGCLLIALWRYGYNKFLSSTIWKTTIVFAGLTPETSELIATLKKQPERGYEVLGIIETNPNNNLALPTASTLQELLTQVNKKNVHLMVVAPSFADNQNFLKELYGQLLHQIQVVDLAEFYEQTLNRLPPFTFSESWFLTHLREQQKKIYDRFRIIIDYIAALVLGIVFIITFPFIALLIKLTSTGPIFFKQFRIGRQEKPFLVYKYRTMKVLATDGSAETHGPQFASLDDPRVTTFGKFLRRTRLDELPQIINVLKNEMGIIGPRPERPEFVQELSKTMPFYPLRHLLKPGLTGWAQLHKSYYAGIEENLRKLEYDLYYVKNRGLLLDIAILLRTINIVVRMKGR
jgi:exopolysaccharide biosynthesis polyprenyl glycosylphosphotransferase